MKKVLYISYDGLTDPLGQSQILPYLSGLSEFGYQFTILSFEKRDRFAREGQIVEEKCRQASIEWVPLFFTAKPPILSKIYDRWQMRRKAFQLFRSHRFDLIHCRSYISAEIGLALKNKFNVAFLFDMRGFWADEKVDGGQWNLKSPFFKRVYRHYKKKEREFLLGADSIISLTEAARLELLRQPDYQNIRVEVIPCCADLEHFDFNRLDPARIAEKRAQLGIPPAQPVISYLGSVGGWYMTAEMFTFFQLLKERFPDYLMLILSKDDPARIREEANKYGVPADSLFITYSPRVELPEYLAISTCSLFFIRPTSSKMASSPTKHAELMGLGLPVVCNDLGDTGRIIHATQSGCVVSDFSTEALKEAIKDIDQLATISPDHIRQAAFRYFDLKEGVKKYLAEYQRILQ